MLGLVNYDELVKSQKLGGKVKSFRCKARKSEGMRRTYRCAAVTEDAAQHRRWTFYEAVKNGLGCVYGYGQNDKGVALLATLAISMILMALGITYYMKSGLEVTLVRGASDAGQAFYNAETGLRYVLYEVKRAGVGSGGWGPIDVHMPGDGAAEAKVECWSPPGADPCINDTWRIVSRGTANNETRTVVAKVQILFNFEGVDAVAALYGPERIQGNVTIDGRNHYMTDPDGAGPLDAGDYNGTDDGNPYVPGDNNQTVYYGSGTYGVYTGADAITLQGSPAIGGTDISDKPFIDHAPVTAYDQSVVHTNRPTPVSADSLFNVAQTLRERALALGGLYTTDPAATEGTYIDNTAPTINLAAVTYIEMTVDVEEASGNDKGKRLLKNPSFVYPAELAYGSSVVVITTKTSDWTTHTKGAALTSFNSTFAGLLVTDAIEHLQGQSMLLGAVVVTADFGKNQTGADALGVGGASILYSRDALMRVFRNVDEDASAQRIDILEWKEDNRERDDNLDLL